MEKVKYSGWNECNNDFIIEIKSDGVMTDSPYDKSDFFDYEYSFLFTVYHLQLRLAKVEDMLDKLPASC